jgi:glycosyltransferase involved in cell wall biosynthesis
LRACLSVKKSRFGTSHGPRPLLSIITPCRNSSNTIRDTIESVENAQSELEKYGHSLEHIIIDGQSNDGTLSIVETYAQRSGYVLFRQDPPRGIYSAMNYGLSLASGVYTHVLNSDDFIVGPRYYAELIIEGSTRGSSALIGSIIYFSNQPMPKQLGMWMATDSSSNDRQFKKAIRNGLHFPHPGFIAKTALYKRNGFDEKYTMSADYKLMQDILLNMTCKEEILIAPDAIVGMRKGGATSGLRAIIQGMMQVNRINRELGINELIWMRYFKKAARHLNIKTF